LYAQNSGFFSASAPGSLPSNQYGVTSIRAGTDRMRVMVMLHELGHVANLLKADGASAPARLSATVNNNDLIWKNCQDTIKAFAN
jgi:hypothetical protein